MVYPELAHGLVGALDVGAGKMSGRRTPGHDRDRVPDANVLRRVYASLRLTASDAR